MTTTAGGAPDGSGPPDPATDRVDAHHHVWDLTVRSEPWIDPDTMAEIDRSFFVEELERLAAPAGVTRSVLVQTVHEVAETREYLELAAGDNLVAAVTGWVDLTAADVSGQLADLQAGVGGHRLRAIRHGVQFESDPGWLTRPEVRAGLRAVAAAGLGYELLTTPVQLPSAILAARELPEVDFVLDHCSKPLIAAGVFDPWAVQIRELAALPNVTCKLSGLVTEAQWDLWEVDTLRPYAEVVLDAFGPERVMFGSDWPVCTLASGYKTWVDAAEELLDGLSVDERAAVWSGTAARVYRLP